MNHVTQLYLFVGSNIFWFVMNMSDSIHVIMIEMRAREMSFYNNHGTQSHAH